jgi:nitroreductase
MILSKPIVEVIKARYSVRTYQPVPIKDRDRIRLAEAAGETQTGPFGNRPRFQLLAASEEDGKALKGLGTYGFIKGPTGFLVGASREADHSLEDFGFLMERLILLATDLGLGTCWLGGTFTKSRFAEKIGLQPAETVPAVASVGYAAGRPRTLDALVRFVPGSDRRLPWESLFFDGSLTTPLSRQAAAEFALPLDMVRLGPSASNRQPWRVVRQGNILHFYLQRSRAYGPSSFGSLWPVADLQRVDMGIAMCHFDLAAKELGLTGQWRYEQPDIDEPNGQIEYTASWIGR